MIFERVVTEGLIQYSYFVGDQGEAFIIDPRYDVAVYLDLARKHNLNITHVFETHRNEDMIAGSKRLGELTGAKVHISGYEKLSYEYGNWVYEENEFEFGSSLKLKPLHTPGHTKGHLSYVLFFEKRPYMVFTGDCLFYGSIGRTDFYGKENLIDMTTKSYESIFNKLKRLGDDVIVMPAHGPGSACGDDFEDRPLSSLGYEFKYNNSLSDDLQEFLKINASMNFKNPAFDAIEIQNLKGGGVINKAFLFKNIADENEVIVDIRDRIAFIGGHIKGSICCPGELLSTYIGWFINADTDIVIMADKTTQKNLELAYFSLLRQGFFNIRGILGEGALNTAVTSGLKLKNIDTISGVDYLKLKGIKTLDVRKDNELLDSDPVEYRIHIPYECLRNKIDSLKVHGKLYILCGSGQRATVAASYILSKVDMEVVVIEGGIQAINSVNNK